jgi:hypothetical protein
MNTDPHYQSVLELLRTEKLAELGPDRRLDAWSIPELDSRLDKALQGKQLSPAVSDLFRGTILLWHDHLDQAHQIVQDIESPDGSFIHAIMHRREPDYGNSKYWFRRVGSHPSFLALAPKVSELLEKREQSDLLSRLVPNKTWDPFAFVDTVEYAMKGQFASQTPLLQQIQKLEFDCLLENLANRS